MKQRKRKAWVLWAAVSLAALALTALVIYEQYPQLYMPVRYRETVETQAAEFGLDCALVYAVIYCESGFDAEAVSHRGACGLMQLMPATAEELSRKYGIDYQGKQDLFRPEVNVALGCSFLGELMEHFGDTTAALAAYNAGRARVKGWLKDPECSYDGKTLAEIPYEETKNYVRRVLAAYEKYRRIPS